MKNIKNQNKYSRSIFIAILMLLMTNINATKITVEKAREVEEGRKLGLANIVNNILELKKLTEQVANLSAKLANKDFDIKEIKNFLISRPLAERTNTDEEKETQQISDDLAKASVINSIYTDSLINVLTKINKSLGYQALVNAWPNDLGTVEAMISSVSESKNLLGNPDAFWNNRKMEKNFVEFLKNNGLEENVAIDTINTIKKDIKRLKKSEAIRYKKIQDLTNKLDLENIKKELDKKQLHILPVLPSPILPSPKIPDINKTDRRRTGRHITGRRSQPIWNDAHEFKEKNKATITFYAKGPNDAIVLLASDKEKKDQLEKGAEIYEIVFGGWGNTLSGIRDKWQQDLHPQQVLNSGKSGSIMDPNNWKKFWITYDNGYIRMGEGEVGKNIIAEYSGPNRGENNIDFTYWNNDVEFKDINIE